MSVRIGVDLGGTKTEAVVLAANDRIVARVRVPTPAQDYSGTIQAVCELVGRLEAECQPVPAVGIATPGTMVPATGLMKNCNATWLNGMPLSADLGKALRRPVRVANDADCFALAEAASGAGKGEAVVFGVILGTGVGGGIVVRGELLAGASGLAGEWGHTPLPYFRSDRAMPEPLRDLEHRLADRACYCGRHNCIETFLSGPGMAATHKELHGQVRSGVEIGRLEDENSNATFHLYCYMLARSLGQIINVIDPAAIVLGGGVSNMGALYPRLSELVTRYVFSFSHATRIMPAVHGDSAGVIGAAWLWPASDRTEEDNVEQPTGID